MFLKKNTILGKTKLNLFILIFIFLTILPIKLYSNDYLEGNITDIKVLDKISSKNTSIQIKNGEEVRYKDLSIISKKCKNSEFDDNPEVTAYLQVKDLTKKNNDNVFVFNGWMFSSSPSIAPFDHPVYDIWLVGCY